MDIALQINNLSKAYGKHQVLENISFTRHKRCGENNDIRMFRGDSTIRYR